jgi:hypothetical protein
MTAAVLACPVVAQAFPEGTTDPGFTFTITGTLADGAPFQTSGTSAEPTLSFDLQPGTYTGVVSKLGVSSLPSGQLVIAAPVTVTLSVPDASQPATLA